MVEERDLGGERSRECNAEIVRVHPLLCESEIKLIELLTRRQQL